MDSTQQEKVSEVHDREEPAEPVASKIDSKSAEEKAKPNAATKKAGKCKHHAKRGGKSLKTKGRRRKLSKDDSSSDSDSDDSEDDEADSDVSSSEDEKCKRATRKHSKIVKKSAGGRRKKSKRHETPSESEDSEDEDSSSFDSSSEDEKPKRKSKKQRKAIKKAKDKSRKKAKQEVESSSTSDDTSDSETEAEESSTESSSAASESNEVDDLQAQVDALKLKASLKQKKRSKKGSKSSRKTHRKSSRSSQKSKKKTAKDSATMIYKRVDQLWDSTIHNYKLKESAEDEENEFSEYCFLVRRKFDWENKYQNTVVDIKSKMLRAVLSDVMKDCKSISLEAEEPTIDPNTLFMYLEELRTYYRKTLKTKIKAGKKRKAIKKLELQRKQCKILVKYLDEDYADVKKTLYPLLAAGNITFELLWALFHPNEVAITSTYGTWEHPRCFKVDFANKFNTMQRGEWYCVEGKYLEYDGKGHGFGDFEVDIDGFKGPRKITSLATYPLKYHKDQEKVKQQIIERGKRFVAMEGMNYQFHKGLAFMKKKKQVAKININGRIMIDPATFRRVNPNYPIALIKPNESEDLFGDTEDEDDSDCCCNDSDDDDEVAGGGRESLSKTDDDDSTRTKYRIVTNAQGNHEVVAVEVDKDGDPIRNQQVDQLPLEGDEELKKRDFTEEELLLTSPVVLGFAFSEKLWLEFTLAGVHPITYNEDAFESLVLPPNQKSIVKALVESHKFHAAKTIDDVVQGKGKGLVAVLHGPPGTGKTLTAEGISELLKCPLYMVSAGELGTDPAKLEYELQKILDIAHSWGAVLLLDEADVFLEKREVHDIHRNALVSIFLRLLEYFQGILFLTTNRVQTFDDAFQSRIHVALRYGELTTKAKKAVWKMFLEMVRKMEGEGSVSQFSDDDLDRLSRHSLNGRQIKNNVRTAQALAVNEKTKLTMEHVKRVLDVAETFDHDLKGGTGYIDAMRSYT